jgi:hypothetical protein
VSKREERKYEREREEEEKRVLLLDLWFIKADFCLA